jgi:hypothetical protein
MKSVGVFKSRSTNRFSWEWARNNVSAHYDPIDPRLLDFLEHGFESGKVAVNIVDCGDAHVVYLAS